MGMFQKTVYTLWDWKIGRMEEPVLNEVKEWMAMAHLPFFHPSILPYKV